MKKFSWEQARGLAWFFLVYVLTRTLLSVPDMGNQNPEIFSIFLGAMTLAWLVYNSQKDEKSLALLASSLSIASLFIYFQFGHFDQLEIQLSLALIGGLSLVIFLFFLGQSVQRMLKKQANIFWPMIIQVAATGILLISFEHFLPLIKNLI